MQIGLKKKQRNQRIEQALKINLKKRKAFQEKIKKKAKNNK
tara:strand:- start:35 stop:157 length:123 start_codon:yes stop_codon:yes gene_type:complete